MRKSVNFITRNFDKYDVSSIGAYMNVGGFDALKKAVTMTGEDIAARVSEAKIKGRAHVLKLFKLQSGDVVVGSKVIAGALKQGGRVSIYDKDPSTLTDTDIPLYTGTVKNLKKGKDEVTIVGRDNECGVFLKPQFDGIKEGMWIEAR